MARKKKAVEKSVRKAKKAPRKAPIKRSKRRKTAAAAKKTVSGRKKPIVGKARKASTGGFHPKAGKPAPVPSPAGETYGEEGWREEELSAAELGVDVPDLDELEAERNTPDIVEEGEEETEW